MKNIFGMTSDIKTSWDLSTFYKGLDDPQINIDIETLKKLVEEFISKYQGKIAEMSPEDLLEFYADDSKIDHIISKVAIYYHDLKSLDTQNQEVIKRNGEFENLMIDLANKTLFISQEFKDMGAEKLLEFSTNPILKDYKNSLVRKADSIKYLLDQKTEFALNLKENSGGSSFNHLYEEYTNSFEFTVNIDGETKVLTEEEVRSLRLSPDENVRKEAYRSIRAVYSAKQTQIALGNTYSALVKDWTSDVKIRGYKTVMSPRNINEEIPDEAINMLLSEVENQYSLYHRFLKAKSKIMGKEKLGNWDLLAPVDEADVRYSFEEGLDLYFKVIKDFDEEFYNFSVDMFSKGRVDVFPKPGKQSGAFSLSEKDFPSYVLLNYTGKLDDVSAIAHELGHATHGYFSQKQKSQLYGTGLCLAETASIFNETLLNQYLSKNLPQNARLSFLYSHISDVFASIFRQVKYVAFEKKVREAILSGKELGYHDFNLLWRAEQEKLQGDVVIYDVEAEKESGWSGIPHIFRTPFYCYSYAFGNILSFALYEMYNQQGDKFIEIYKNILKSGGSKTPYDLLIQYGIDITKPEFYRTGLKVVEGMVEEFEKLIG